MRVRTEHKRRAIMNVAAELFREVGYERASMAAISARVGGSKSTIYGYFPSKDELFAAAMIKAMEGHSAAVTALLEDDSKDLRAALMAFGKAYLDLIMSDEVIAITRTVVAAGPNSRLGPALYDQGPRRWWKNLEEWLGRQDRLGRLRVPDPVVTACHLEGLLEGGLTEPALFGAKARLGRKRALIAAIDAFMKLYGPESA